MALSHETIATVKATVPILKQNGVLLTEHFYKRMFENNPEVKPFFNPAHQDGSQQQALAGAIVAYAQNIDNLSALTQAVEIISNKHASLTVKPEHYPIVGENLLGAISEVLGASANAEIIEAWREAYEFLAQILISSEADIYKNQSESPSGWEGFRNFQIIRKERESAEITSFYFEPVDGKGLPSFEVGQFLTLRLPHPDAGTTMRNYSISAPPNGRYFRISVKLEAGRNTAPDGYASGYLHNKTSVGDEIEVGPPCGHFTLGDHLDSERPLVFIAGGVGVTPLFSMAQVALERVPHRSITFIHACRTPDVQAFASELTKLHVDHPNIDVHFVYEQPKGPSTLMGVNFHHGIISFDLIRRFSSIRGALFYFCGPPAFMDAVKVHLNKCDVDENNMKYEYFGPQ